MQNSIFDVCTEREVYSGKYIYETKGRAKEYRELACNLYTGCDHGCVYCYAPDVTRKNRNLFYSEVYPRKDIISKLAVDAKKYAMSGDSRQVLFCFTCDPYCKANDVHGLTRKAIATCHDSGMSVCILTKGGNRSAQDLDLFTARDSYASTLTLTDDNESLKWEPGAAPTSERIDALKKYHDAGIPTWVSLEPVIEPQDTMRLIESTHEFVDEFKVGVLNYHQKSYKIDWKRFANEVVELLTRLECNYYLKHDIRKYL